MGLKSQNWTKQTNTTVSVGAPEISLDNWKHLVLFWHHLCSAQNSEKNIFKLCGMLSTTFLEPLQTNIIFYNDIFYTSIYLSYFLFYFAHKIFVSCWVGISDFIYWPYWLGLNGINGKAFFNWEQPNCPAVEKHWEEKSKLTNGVCVCVCVLL